MLRLIASPTGEGAPLSAAAKKRNRKKKAAEGSKLKIANAAKEVVRHTVQTDPPSVPIGDLFPDGKYDTTLDTHTRTGPSAANRL